MLFRSDDPIKEYKMWKLVLLPTSKISSPEYYDQDDRYRRVIDVDWEHLGKITKQDIMDRPVVVDDEGWILDGNHRVTAARAGGIKRIPALVPYK